MGDIGAMLRCITTFSHPASDDQLHHSIGMPGKQAVQFSGKLPNIGASNTQRGTVVPEFLMVERPMLCFSPDREQSAKHPISVEQATITYADQIARLAIDQHRNEKKLAGG